MILSMDVPARALTVVKDVVFPRNLGMHSLRDGSQIRISLAVDEEIISWQALLFFARELLSLGERV